MKYYDIAFDYYALGHQRKTFTARVNAYNKGEALIRAGAEFRAREGRGLPDCVDSISVTTQHARILLTMRITEALDKLEELRRVGPGMDIFRRKASDILESVWQEAYMEGKDQLFG